MASSHMQSSFPITNVHSFDTTIDSSRNEAFSLELVTTLAHFLGAEKSTSIQKVSVQELCISTTICGGSDRHLLFRTTCSLESSSLSRSIIISSSPSRCAPLVSWNQVYIITNWPYALLSPWQRKNIQIFDFDIRRMKIASFRSVRSIPMGMWTTNSFCQVTRPPLKIVSSSSVCWDLWGLHCLERHLIMSHNNHICYLERHASFFSGGSWHQPWCIWKYIDNALQIIIILYPFENNNNVNVSEHEGY